MKDYRYRYGHTASISVLGVFWEFIFWYILAPLLFGTADVEMQTCRSKAYDLI